MRLHHMFVLVAFCTLCMVPFFNVEFQRESVHSKDWSAGNPLITWNQIEDLREAQFFHNNLFIVVRENWPVKTAAIFLKGGQRDDDDLALYYWTYAYDVETGKLMTERMQKVTYHDFFKSREMMKDIYIPPRETFSVYPDAIAEKNGWPKIPEGPIGFDYRNYVHPYAPWKSGVLLKYVKPIK